MNIWLNISCSLEIVENIDNNGMMNLCSCHSIAVVNILNEDIVKNCTYMTKNAMINL